MKNRYVRLNSTFSVLLVIPVVVFLGAAILPLTGLSSGHRRPFSLGAFIVPVVVMLTAVLGMWIWTRPAQLRLKALRLSIPSAIILTCTVTAAMRPVFQQAAHPSTEFDSRGYFGQFVTATFDKSGLVLWSGSRIPSQVLSVRWSDIESVTAGEKSLKASTVPAIVIAYRTSNGQAVLPLIVGNAGWGALNESTKFHSNLAERIILERPLAPTVPEKS